MGNHWSNLTDAEKSAFLNAGLNIRSDIEEQCESQSQCDLEQHIPTLSEGSQERWPTTEELVAGFEAIRERITPQQMTMLRANYHAEGRATTMHELAIAAGYDSYRSANIQYGSLAKGLYQAMDYPPPQSRNTTGTFWVLGIGEFIDRREDGLDMLCVMRPEVARALEIVGFVGSQRSDIPDRAPGNIGIQDGSSGSETLRNCNPGDIIDSLGCEMDLMDNPMGVAWRCWLHPDAYANLKSSVDIFEHQPFIYEENGHEYLKVYDNNVIPFIIHMRIAGLNDQVPSERGSFEFGGVSELDPEFPVPTAQRNALAAHGMVPVGESAEVLPRNASSEEPRYIQSCVTSIGFPSDFDELEMMFEKWEDPVDHQYTDLEVILKFNQLGFDLLEWTAARWMTEGDVLFFYHTNRGHKLIKRLLREFRETPAQIQREYYKLGQTLERNLEISTRVEGCIFACALVEGTAQYHAKEENEHFKSRNFVPFTRVHVFETPLHSRDFGEHFRIGQNTVTPLYRRNFGAIRDLLARDNDLPDFLRDADVGELIFQNISSENWREIVSSSQTRFLNEELVREYFIDYLLDEIRDPRTPILEECVTWRSGQSTGRADYFVKIGGRWIPVEAKLNIHSERDLLGQIGKYLRLEKFVPTIRQRRTKEFSLESHATCIVIDQSGVYLTHDQNFIDCDFGRPWLARENVTEDFQDRLRQAVLSLG